MSHQPVDKIPPAFVRFVHGLLSVRGIADLRGD